MSPQAREVLIYLKGHGSIEPMDALKKLGVYRLAARIHEIREDGHLVDTAWVKVSRHTKYGKYIYKGQRII